MRWTWNKLPSHRSAVEVFHGPSPPFPFQSPPFWWFMPTQLKTTRTSAISIQIRTQICFESNLAYMDHSLPPLGLFLQINLKFLSLSQTHLLRHKESHSKRNWFKISKTPLFPIINISPHKKPTFDKRDNKRVLTKQKTLFYYFQYLSSGSWSIYHFGLYFLPLWHQAPKRDQSWPFNPIASPKSSNKSTKAIRV